MSRCYHWLLSSWLVEMLTSCSVAYFLSQKCWIARRSNFGPYNCAAPTTPLWVTQEFCCSFVRYICTSLTSQSALPTEAVEAQRAIKGPAPATKTKPIHLRLQRDRMQATYSNPKPTHKNSRKNDSVWDLHQAF